MFLIPLTDALPSGRIQRQPLRTLTRKGSLRIVTRAPYTQPIKQRTLIDIKALRSPAHHISRGAFPSAGIQARRTGASPSHAQGRAAFGLGDSGVDAYLTLAYAVVDLGPADTAARI